MIVEEAHHGAALQGVAQVFQEYTETRRGDAAYDLVSADLAALPGPYSPPSGALLLAREGNTLAGCLAFRDRGAHSAEMKRLYVKPAQRHAGVARRLCHAMMRLARRRGFEHMCLDSIPGMDAARHLYTSLGFARTSPYWENPNPDTWYFDIDLVAWCRDETRYLQYIALVNEALRITDRQITHQFLPLVHECPDLSDMGPDMYRRPQQIAATALPHWRAMLAHARQDGLELQVVSAFRSVEYQATLIAQKCDAGRSLIDVLKVNAAPGYSEHHAGTALDLSSPGSEPLSEDFATSPAFDWIQNKAHHYGFSMSYAQNNPHALVYEPWHWAWS